MKNMKTSLASISLLLCLAATPLLSRSPAPEESLMDNLAFMRGRWVVDTESQYIEETWGPAREDAMVGSLRWARKGEVWLYELMSIEADEEHGLVFRLRHFGRGLEPWKSEAEGALTYPLQDFSENRVVFENPERDDPRRFVYEREGDTLTVRVEGPEEGKGDPFVFRLDP
jgi:hypothetical protein